MDQNISTLFSNVNILNSSVYKKLKEIVLILIEQEIILNEIKKKELKK